MDYVTIGRTNNAGRLVNLYYQSPGEFNETCICSFRAVLIEEGSLIVELDGEKTLLESPALLCLNNKHDIKILKTQDITYQTLYFKPTEINSQFTYELLEKQEKGSEVQTERMTDFQDLFYIQPFSYNPQYGTKCIKLGPQSLLSIKKLMGAIGKELGEQTDGLWPCRSRSLFLELLYYIFNIKDKYIDYRHPLEGDMDFIEPVLLYLHSHFDEDISLGYLTEKFNTNRTTLNKLFVEKTGKTVIAYLIELRLKFASLVLRDTFIPIKEVVARSGFKDSPNFIRAFKKQYEDTPTEYREKYNWMMGA